MRLRWLAFFLPLTILSIDASRAQSVSVADILSHENGLWSLEPAGSIRRWVVIHNLRGLNEGTVLHIEVLARKDGAPAWSVDHLADHMAITMSALRSSIRQPLTRGAVYPETFDNALRLWTQQRASGAAPLCTTSVDRCLRGDW